MYDVIIVGGGPAGLTASIYLLRSKKKVLTIEKEVFGGQITKAQTVENYPGFTSINGLELGSQMKKQADALGLESVYDEVTKIKKDQETFTVTGKEKTYLSKAVIYAAGTSPKNIGLSNEKNYLGKGLSYCATCDGAFFKNKIVCVVGGGNTAIEDAIYLANICQKVYLIHRRNEFRAEPIRIHILKEKKNIECIYNATITEINGEKKLEKIKINKEGKIEELFIDGLFVAIGSVPNTKIINDFVPLTSDGFIKTNYQLETLIPGFFAAGDVREKRVRQLTTAVNDGTISAIEVGNYLEEI